MTTLVVAAALGVVGSGLAAYGGRRKLWAAAWIIQAASYAYFWWAAAAFAQDLGFVTAMWERVVVVAAFAGIGAWFVLRDLRSGLGAKHNASYVLKGGR